LGLAPLVVRQIFGAIRDLNRQTGSPFCSSSRTRFRRCVWPIAATSSSTGPSPWREPARNCWRVRKSGRRISKAGAERQPATLPGCHHDAVVRTIPANNPRPRPWPIAALVPPPREVRATSLRFIRRRRKSAHRNSLNGVVSLAQPPARRKAPASERNGSSISAATDFGIASWPRASLVVVRVHPTLVVEHEPEGISLKPRQVRDHGDEHVLDFSSYSARARW